MKKLPYTPNSQIKSAIRRLFLRSREHSACMKENDYTCQTCGKKQSKANGREVSVECHHEDGIDWAGLCEDIRRRVLSGKLVTLCKDCHKKEHGK